MRNLICNLLWVGLFAVSLSVSAAPISGSFQVDLVIHSATCGVDNDGDTFVDNGPNDPCFKVDDTVMKFEADLLFQLTISGLEIGSTTVFTFKGLEYQAFTLGATMGALSM